jgi:hypothetical protein
LDEEERNSRAIQRKRGIHLSHTNERNRAILRFRLVWEVYEKDLRNRNSVKFD